MSENFNFQIFQDFGVKFRTFPGPVKTQAISRLFQTVKTEWEPCLILTRLLRCDLPVCTIYHAGWLVCVCEHYTYIRLKCACTVKTLQQQNVTSCFTSFTRLKKIQYCTTSTSSWPHRNDLLFFLYEKQYKHSFVVIFHYKLIWLSLSTLAWNTASFHSPFKQVTWLTPYLTDKKSSNYLKYLTTVCIHLCYSFFLSNLEII